MMSNSESSTIAALATAPSPAGVAVIRISGPKTRSVLRALFRGSHDPVSDPRRLVFGEILDHHNSEPIDKALAVFMPGPNSYTGEDVGELQCHGSPLLVEQILQSLFAFGIIPAEAGEFTKRAFLNNKIDLVQAEAIGDLISASSERALRIAQDNLQGKLSSVLQEIGEPLRDLLAEVEASIDFPDEDISPKKRDQMKTTIQASLHKLSTLLETFSFGATVKEGFRVLLTGRPNVGKSSILNLLLGHERAIVTDISGTTRDLIEENAMLGGFKFVFCDSAGLTETDNIVEKIGIERAKERFAWADLVVLVADASDTTNSWEQIGNEIREHTKKLWLVINKIDLNPKAIGHVYCDSTMCLQNIYISAKSKDGIKALSQALVDEVKYSLQNSDSNSIITSERHRLCLLRAQDALVRILEEDVKQPFEILSVELRDALSALEEIVGKTTTEDILGRIFSSFCIGK